MTQIDTIVTCYFYLKIHFSIKHDIFSILKIQNEKYQSNSQIFQN